MVALPVFSHFQVRDVEIPITVELMGAGQVQRPGVIWYYLQIFFPPKWYPNTKTKFTCPNSTCSSLLVPF